MGTVSWDWVIHSIIERAGLLQGLEEAVVDAESSGRSSERQDRDDQDGTHTHGRDDAEEEDQDRNGSEPDLALALGGRRFNWLRLLRSGAHRAAAVKR